MKQLRNFTSGFTLVEILLTVSISFIVAAVLLQLSNHYFQSYSLIRRDIADINKTRAFHVFFQKEISSILPNTTFTHIPETDHLNTDQISFFRVLPFDNPHQSAPGDIELVSYYVSFLEDKNRVSPVLFRSTKDPVKSLEHLLTNHTNPSDLREDSEPIFSNILSFDVKPMIYDSSSSRMIPWTANSATTPDSIEFHILYIDDSASHFYNSVNHWKRLARAPKMSENRFIRAFNHTYWIRK